MLAFKCFDVFRTAKSVRRRGAPRGRGTLGYDTCEPRVMLAADVFESTAVLNPNVADFQVQSAVERIVDGTPVDLENDPYPSVGLVGDVNDFFCSGTLIASRYVLTAAHCVAGVSDTQGAFRVGGQTYGTVRVEVHPKYNDFNFSAGYDIAVFELDRDVVGITPSALYRSVPTVGQELTLVGFGGGGTGAAGSNGDFGTKRVGTTPIDQVTGQHIRWDFEESTANPESNTAPGDSGGPAFINVNGSLQVAGITSGGSFGAAGFGDNSFDARVDIFIGYITAILGGVDDHADLPGTGATFIAHGSDGTVRSSGVLNRIGDRDVFELQFRQDGYVTFRVNGTNTFDPVVRLYDQDGSFLAQNNDFDGVNSRLAVNVEAGTYYFSVGSLTDGEFGKFNLWTSLKTIGPAPADDHVDVADASATYYQLDGNQTGRQEGRIERRGDRDVFKITVPNSGQAVVRVSGFGGLNPDLRIFDSAGRLVTQNDDFNGALNAGAQFQFVPGVYYVSVGSSNQSSTGSYRIWSSFKPLFFRDDHGGFINNSTGLSLRATGSAVGSGEIQSSRDGDMFSFKAIRFTTQMVVRTAAKSGGLDTVLSVFDSSGRRLATNDDAFGTDSRAVFSARRGDTFYVLVEGKLGSLGKYNLAVFSRN